jgi:hypothetical protein
LKRFQGSSGHHLPSSFNRCNFLPPCWRALDEVNGNSRRPRSLNSHRPGARGERSSGRLPGARSDAPCAASTQAVEIRHVDDFAAGITHLGATPRTAAAERKAILVAVIGDRERVARYQSRADLLILEAGRARLDGLIRPRGRAAARRRTQPMASPRSLTPIEQLLELLNAERDRRAGHFGGPGGDPRQELMDQLALMAERMEAAPGYVPPSPAQLAEWGRDLDRRFAEYARRAR